MPRSIRRPAPAIPFLALLGASCLHDSGDDAPRASLGFLSLAVPAEIVAGTAATLDVSFHVGPDQCWEVESLTVRRAGAVIRVEGTARKPDPDAICALAIAEGSATLAFPVLEPGEYVVLAGDLFQNVRVVTAATGARDRFAYLGPVAPNRDGCDLTGNSAMTVALSGLAPDLPAGSYLVRGAITGADPCRFADPPAPRIDYFVTVDEVLPPPEE